MPGLSLHDGSLYRLSLPMKFKVRIRACGGLAGLIVPFLTHLVAKAS